MTTLVTIAPPPSPYKGLAPFDDTELDAYLFFGRSWETEVVSANVLASRLTVLYGPSGVGKSSLLRAGVVRTLRAEPGLPRPAVAYYGSWAGDPLTGLREASQDAVAHALGREPADAPGDLADQLAAWGAELGGEICLLLDQLEELFLYHPGEGAGGFVDLLPELVGRPGLRVNVLLGIRDDALSQLDVFKSRIPALFANSLRLDHLDREAGRAAIIGPLACFAALADSDVEAEPELVESVLDEVATGRIEPELAGRGAVAGAVALGGLIETPYLQLVMNRIWEVERERGSTTLRLETFRDLGGAKRIVEDHLERALHALTPTEQDAAASVFGHLVTPSGTKIAHGVSDLASYAHVGESDLEPVLRALAGQRILRPLGENGHAGGRYEIFHDVLAGAVLAWRTRHDADAALVREREAARRRQRRLAWLAVAALVGLALMTALAAYAFSQRSKAREQAELASDQKAAAEQNADDLAAALRSAEREEQRATKAEEDAIDQQHIAEEATGRANEQTKKANDAALAADQNAQRAEEGEKDALEAQNIAEQESLKAIRANLKAKAERRRAEVAYKAAVSARKVANARRLVAQSLAAVATDPEQSARLALQASSLDQSSNTENALRAALVALHVQHVFPHAGPKPVARFSRDGRRLVTGGGSRQVSVYTSHGNRLWTFRNDVVVNDVALSRDGGLAAAAGADGRVRIWNVNSGELARTVEHEAVVTAVAWSPVDDVLATGGAGPNPSVRLWNPATGDLLHRLPHSSDIRRVSFSGDGTRVLTVGSERSAHVFEVATGVPLSTLEHPGGQITSAVFGPGNIVVTGGTNDTARIWEANGALRHVLGDHTGDVLDVAVSPNGDYVATASLDSLTRVFDARTGSVVDVLRDHGGPAVNDVDFSPSTTGPGWGAIVTAGSDRTARYWAPGQQPVVLLGHDGRVLGAAFSPDGSSVLTSSRDGSARLWDVLGDRPLRVLERRTGSVGVTSVAVNDSGSEVASGGSDGVVRVVGSDGSVLRTLPAMARPIESVAWGTDGRLLAASTDGVAQVWGEAGDQPLATIRHGAEINAASLSTDGSLVATAGARRVRVWRVSGEGLVDTLDPPGATPVRSVAFDKAGPRIALATGLFAYLSSIGTGEFTRLEGHENTVSGVAFDRTGKLLATSSNDLDARVWEVRAAKSRPPFVGHGTAVVGVAFSADSRWLATAASRKAALWQVGKSDLPRNFLFFLAGHTGQLTSVAFSPRDWTVVTGSADGTVRTYRCAYCGRLTQLIPLARAHLARLSAERKR
jgi:WD40 repeat protein